jgi:cyclophilin family peptidyl-prolyl cis-trans isomerase
LTLRVAAAASLLIAAIVPFIEAGPSNSVAGQAAAAPLMHPDSGYWTQTAPAVFRAIIATSKGDFVIEVHRDWAPLGVDRLYNLVRAGFFDDSRFFRVREGYIVQFGIAGDPKVAAVWRNQAIKDDPSTRSNLRGTVAYAMTGPDTRTTQLYINLGDNSRLDSQGFAPIGRVTSGMEVVDRLYSGYGETAGGGMRGGNQGKIFEGGNAYLDSAFPRLDKLLRARIDISSTPSANR